MTRNARDKNELAAVAALARGEDMGRVAQESGLSPSTIQRRLRDAEFADDVARARQLMLERACSQLSDVMVSAVGTLAELLQPENSPNVRLNAAKTILEHAAKLRAVVDLERRLDALERVV